MTKLINRKRTLQITMVPPAGIFSINEKIMPQMTDRTEKTAETAIVALKLTVSWRAVNGGRISMAETSIIPVTFMAKTAATAVNKKRMIFIRFVLIPMLRANSSSKVTANRS